MSATTQHAAIEALVSIWDAALDIPVFDGPTVIDGSEATVLFVGCDVTKPDSEAVSSQQTYAQLGARRKEETGTITCSLVSWSGDSETLGRRVECATNLSAAEAALRADITLGGAVLYSNFGENVSLSQQLVEQGNEVAVVFTVTFTSRI